jgi:hypothetical protein
MTDMYIEGRKICVEQKNIHKNNLYYEWLGRVNVVDRHCCLFFLSIAHVNVTADIEMLISMNFA